MTYLADRRLFVVLIAIQTLTLSLLMADIWGQQRLRRQQHRLLERASQDAARAGQLAAEARFGPAQKAYQRAASRAAGAGSLLRAEDWELAARQAEALSAVARQQLPRRAELPALRELADELAAASAPDARGAAVALEAACLQAEGDIPAAVDRLRRALQEEGATSPWLHWQLGLALLRQQAGSEEAVGELEQVLGAVPGFGPALHQLGLAHLSLGHRERAVEGLQQAVAKGAGLAAALDLARLLLDDQRWADAVPHLETVLRADPGNVEALRLLGSALYRLERFEQAADTYRKAYGLQPEPRTLLSAVIALHGGRSHEQALALLEPLLPQAAAVPEIRYERALLLLDMKRTADAGSELEAYIQLASTLPAERQRVAEAKHRLARLYAEK